jgi:hypothetical protein
MPSESWFRKLWSRLWSGVVQDVPPSLEACEACRRTDCTDRRWHVCAERLATEAIAVYGVEALSPITSKTDEMPELDADSNAGEDEAPAEAARSPSRKLSTC